MPRQCEWCEHQASGCNGRVGGSRVGSGGGRHPRNEFMQCAGHRLRAFPCAEVPAILYFGHHHRRVHHAFGEGSHHGGSARRVLLAADHRSRRRDLREFVVQVGACGRHAFTPGDTVRLLLANPLRELVNVRGGFLHARIAFMHVHEEHHRFGGLPFHAFLRNGDARGMRLITVRVALRVEQRDAGHR